MNTLSKSGIELITHERTRQVTQEGWTCAHDQTHTSGQLIDAAICYAMAAAKQARGSGIDHLKDMTNVSFLNFPWPWEDEWWKPSEDIQRNLVKAGALLAAELDRLNKIAHGPRTFVEGPKRFTFWAEEKATPVKPPYEVALMSSRPGVKKEALVSGEHIILIWESAPTEEPSWIHEVAACLNICADMKHPVFEIDLLRQADAVNRRILSALRAAIQKLNLKGPQDIGLNVEDVILNRLFHLDAENKRLQARVAELEANPKA